MELTPQYHRQQFYTKPKVEKPAKTEAQDVTNREVFVEMVERPVAALEQNMIGLLFSPKTLTPVTVCSVRFCFIGSAPKIGV
ncbi:hypothetical protein Q3G72_022488 [Acer saccharum]|nr:hypothetical protein Q3G72_022488 [Acer saccharum]